MQMYQLSLSSNCLQNCCPSGVISLLNTNLSVKNVECETMLHLSPLMCWTSFIIIIIHFQHIKITKCIACHEAQVHMLAYI